MGRNHDLPMMISRSSDLLCVLLLLAILASRTFAFTDPKPHKSPDGRFMIINVGDTAQHDHHFELRAADGLVVFTLKGFSGFDVPSFAEDILWSKDGKFVAVSISTGKYLEDTLVIATATGRALNISTEDEDYQTRPIRWTRLGELVVETKAPFGGKADDDLSWLRYHYRRTFRVRDGGAHVECVYRSPLVYPYRAQLLKEGYQPR